MGNLVQRPSNFAAELWQVLDATAAEQGQTTPKFMAELFRRNKSVRAQARKLGIDIPVHPDLHTINADEVRQLHAEGLSERQIAAKLKCSKSGVHNILTKECHGQNS